VAYSARSAARAESSGSATRSSIGLAGHELADAGLELAFADRADLPPEAAQDAAEAALDIPQLGHQQLARG
jgi:hypothetical protein